MNVKFTNIQVNRLGRKVDLNKNNNSDSNTLNVGV